jgi:ABC-type Fe3+/spermidine/putrescine transport system ATPase subunit
MRDENRTHSSAVSQGVADTRSDGSGETPAVEVRGLEKVYNGEILAVDGIDFSVQEGDFCVIIGPSGCGKSTTLHSLIGKVEPTDGRVFIDGQDVTDTPTYKRDIGLVFQDFQLFPHLTVEENVRYGLDRLGREDDEIVEETMDLMNLTGSQNESTRELSAGQRQRVALARSLVLRPKVLLLDEPLGDMDYKLQKRMERELLRIHREVDTTFIYVTHDQRQAMRMGDHLIVMNEGLIEQAAPAEEIYQNPRTAFVAAFVGDSNIFSGSLAETDDTLEVRTPFGSFQVYGDRETENPNDVSFVVRPHSLHVAPGTADATDGAGERAAANRLTGTVLDVIGQPGSGTQILVEVTGEDETREIQAKTWNRDAVSALATGDTVTVSWEPADAQLLTRDSVATGVDLERDILGE